MSVTLQSQSIPTLSLYSHSAIQEASSIHLVWVKLKQSLIFLKESAVSCAKQF